MKNYRVGYAAGGVIKKVIQGGKKISKKISDAARKQDTADRIKVFEHAGPHEGEVITKRILGKGTKKGDRTKAAVKDAVAAKPWAGKPHAEGGRIGRAAGGWTRVIPQKKLKKLDFPGDRKGKPHSSREGRRDSWVRGARRAVESAREKKATGGITKISKILKQIKKGVVDRNVKSKEVKKLLEKSKARSKEKAGWGAHLKRRSRVFKEGQAKHKALDIKEGKKKKYIKRDPHEGVPSQSSDWPYWRGDE